MNPETHFTDKSAVVRGLQVVEKSAPLFSKFLSERERMLGVARETIEAGFLATGRAMKNFAEGMK